MDPIMKIFYFLVIFYLNLSKYYEFDFYFLTYTFQVFLKKNLGVPHLMNSDGFRVFEFIKMVDFINC